MLKNKGPKIEPRGIPVLTSSKLESEFSNWTYWKRFVKDIGLQF